MLSTVYGTTSADIIQNIDDYIPAISTDTSLDILGLFT